MNISLLYVGDVGDAWLNSTKHWDILAGLCDRSSLVNLIDISSLDQRRFMRRLDGRAFVESNIQMAQTRILNSIEDFKPDVVWLEKPLMLDFAFLKKIKQLPASPFLICRQDDNPFGARGYESIFWKKFIGAIPFYDLHLVKREIDKENFANHGAKNIDFFHSGYDQREFSPSKTLVNKDYDFSFVGTNFDGRSNFLYLLRQKLKSNNFYISGQRWNRSFIKLTNPRHVSSGIINDWELRDIIQRSHACLGLFSLSNHDEFSGRAFQIAASGGVLVAPRSKMHEFFFKDGEEALFFDDVEGCKRAITLLLDNPGLSYEIGANAAKRALLSGYSLQARLKQAVSKLLKLY